VFTKPACESYYVHQTKKTTFNIHACVSHITKCSFQAFRFLQLHLQRVIENDLQFSDLVTTYDNHFQQHTAEQEWQLNIPPFKGNCAAATMTALAYMFNDEFSLSCSGCLLAAIHQT
jgi:hypothetical protein